MSTNTECISLSKKTDSPAIPGATNAELTADRKYVNKNVASFERKLIELSSASSGKHSKKLDEVMEKYDEFLIELGKIEEKRNTSSYYEYFWQDKHEVYKRGLKKIKLLIKDHFEKDLRSKGFDPLNLEFEDFESYVSGIPQAEYLQALFLYIQGNFDTTDNNEIIKSPEAVFSSKQGECDDISFFIDYFARKRGIKGLIVSQDRVKETKQNHVAFFVEGKDDILVIDQSRYFKADKAEWKVDNYKDLLKVYYGKTAQAKVLHRSLGKTGQEKENIINKNFINGNVDYIRDKHPSK